MGGPCHPGGVEDPLSRLAAPSDRRVAVRVTDDAVRQIRGGHPWVFESSITSSGSEARTGDLAVIFDGRRRFQGIGLYDEASPIRVRVLHHGRPVQLTEEWWQQRLAAAVERRAALLTSTATTGFRCIHGENDGLPGLVVDRYAAALVVKLYTAAWVPHLPAVVPLLLGLLPSEVVVLRLSRSLEAGGALGLGDGAVLAGDPPRGPILFRENDLVLEADIVAGQKTGHFLDQRDNRRLVGTASSGARVLDVFACTGGFSLSAAAGGARSVHSVDASPHALDAARRNFTHNDHRPAVRACRLETTAGDAFAVMGELSSGGRRFDVVVVDPPSFAQRQADVEGALRSYRRLARLAAGLVEDGGLLVQASCSSRVATDDFVSAVHQGAADASVRLAELRRTGHPADHPIGFQHGAYLKAVLACVHRR
jgi:23S rRNA (cytosine1962-C5)-methyltransferase